MKKTIRAALIAVICGLSLTFAMTSCSSKLERAVKEMQSELPYNVGEGFDITECEIRGGNVEIVMSMDETEISLADEFFKQVMSAMSSEIKEEFVNDEDILPLLRACKDENTGLRVILKGNQSGTSLTMAEFTPEELKANSNI